MNQAEESEGVDPGALREQLFDLWSRKELEALRLQAVSGFSQLQEPLSGLLSILEGCPGIQKGRSTTLGQIILTEFVIWRRSHPRVSLKVLEEQKKLDLRLQALSLLTSSQPGYLEPLLEIYELEKLEQSLLLEHVVYLQKSSCYREAAMLAIKVGLQKDLDMQQMCVPLILLDKLTLAEAFVCGDDKLQERLVRLLDSWCSPDFSLKEVQRQYPHLLLSKHRTDQIQPKLLIRQVFRLMERFNIDPGLCVNSVHKRKLDSLRFLMYKRFGEKSMTEENWRDHVQVTVEGDVELQVVLVEQLVKHCGVKAAAQWAKRFGVPRDRLPFGVLDTMETLSLSQLELNDVDSLMESWVPPSHQQHFYQLPLTKDKVHFLQNLEELQHCREAVLQTGNVVGVDMEWRAGFGTVCTQRLALIQLAVKGQVFLLDLCAPGLSHHSLTVNFIRSLLTDESILKLGYGMSGDLKSLVATWPELKEEPLVVKGVLDLLHVHQQLQRCWRRNTGSRSVEVNEGPAEKGLSLLVQQVLGKPLDKTEQLSNWERRPLRTSQLRYAAVDAYCLLEVYLTLSEDLKAFGLPDDLCSVGPSPRANSGQEKKAKDKKKQAADRRARQSASSCVGDQGECLRGNVEQQGATIVPQELRVVCDNMLQGLGRYLRCLGVDVLMLENTDDHKVAAKIAQTEGRIILTSGQPFQSLRSQVAEGRCLTLDCSEKARDQAVRVLKHFNVRLTASDIFSRCQACNNDEYLKVNREDMTRMMNKRGLIQDTVPKQADWSQPSDGQLDYNRSRPPDGPVFSPHCRWAPHSSLDPHTFRFSGGAEVQLETVPPGLLPRIPEYFICTRCGKVFWEGTHFDRALSQFQDVLYISDEASASQQ
ncbi:exonuclease mut-7 homolog [Trichomycterus rosablanca]|uniref:exonuclease mut-7 homolog n=1 Tax=Trichomycterus rosablanca TaxID=2290929 RepID=UPI002F35DFF2